MAAPVPWRQTHLSSIFLNKLKHSKPPETSKLKNSELQPGFVITTSFRSSLLHTYQTVTWTLQLLYIILDTISLVKKKDLDILLTSKIERVIWNSIKTVMYRQLLFHGNKAIHKSTGFRGRQAPFLHSINSFQLPALETFFWEKLYESSLVLKVLMTFRHLISKPSLGLASKPFVRDLIPRQFKHPISLILTKKKPHNILATWLNWYALTQQWNESNWMQGYRFTAYTC